ncbi:MAG: TatD family hydrolase [Treponemataceae bacterium]
MLTDTHCHLFSRYDDKKLKELLPEVIQNLRFVLDIGTEPNDLQVRLSKAINFFGSFENIPDSLRFSVGIWPAVSYIDAPEKSVEILESKLVHLIEMGAKTAVGECGIDRWWNGKNAKNHKLEQGSENTLGEELLFELQLRLAEKYSLPVIVHSRDAFAETLKVIDKVGYHNGVIHCYSYGVEEIKPFLERGWYISFSGNCTFAKTNVKKAETAELIKALPLEKMLLETDAPYLAPAPFRGKTNTPLLVKYVYEKVAEVLTIEMDTLSDIIFKNAINLFG